MRRPAKGSRGGGYTRRRFLARAGIASVAGAAIANAPLRYLVPGAKAATGGVLTDGEARTLRAAVARIVPAEGPGDWSAADLGADSYIAGLLEGDKIFAGGPVRSRFGRFQRLWRIKRIGWRREVRRLRRVYREGLAALNSNAGGDFAALPAPVQDAILLELDLSNSPFFKALFNHTMEGVYGHPVYGGNRDFRAWQSFGYEGDVHGVRFPGIGPADAPWNVHGGYAPEEMVQPGGGA